MHNCGDNSPEAWAEAARAALLAVALGLAGCAAPGNPLPPTLNLPAIVSPKELHANRVGGEVRLQWTTPKQTTDKLPVKGPIAAEICREPASGAKETQRATCVPVGRLAVTPGKSVAVDTLPGTLTAGPARLLAYRVQLMNAAGRTAGPSAAVYAAAGAAPDAPADFAGETTSVGVQLHWRQQTGAASVELERTVLDPAVRASTERKAGLPGTQKQAVEISMAAGDPGSPDAGGTVDRTVELGHSYRYTAQRVVKVTVGGQTLELRSEPSEALTFLVRDVFPPSAPEELVAVPAFVAQKPAIDLSWEPVMDQDVKPKVAGYKVYRTDSSADAWKLLGAVTAAAYRDAAVVAGQQYKYRVTAVSTSGNESPPSHEAQETAPQAQP
jgi:hypothetical protein